ncbi:sensor histidine kinase NtrY-like [Neomegalonema perideroedes]|uniref:sensor histidine kinase NtrY-like n=1 Tax=Neomegalonema perideroedes TaxID=217219 RepID=UPI0012FE0430|nr:PAS domain-containing sensor histidine kinase [Neomegalonema perideroedes]
MTSSLPPSAETPSAPARLPLRKRINVPALLAILAPFCAAATYAVLTSPDDSVRRFLPALVLADMGLALALLAAIAWRVAKMVLARRRRSSGSRLHLRMVRMFTILAVAPALLLGVLAGATVTRGLDMWFGPGVRSIAEAASTLASVYREQRDKDILEDAGSAMADMTREAGRGSLSPPRMSDSLTRTAERLRNSGETTYYVVTGDARIIARSEGSYEFYYTPPPPNQLALATPATVRFYVDVQNRASRALARLPETVTGSVEPLYLYASRPAGGGAVEAYRVVESLTADYRRLLAQRGEMQLTFAAIYIGFALLVVLAAIWFGIWFADRLTAPVSRLAGAAERVAGGDLSARVPDSGEAGDEIAMLGRVFNRMTEQVELQRDLLVEAHEESESRRQFIEAVLAGAGAGILRVDGAGRVELANASAETLLDLPEGSLVGRSLKEAAPALARVAAAAAEAPNRLAESKVSFSREGSEIEALVRASADSDPSRGVVVTFDDMTDMAAAQRLAAWSDVARRVAHEIKNPLTPIQLSAERLRRKFGKQIEADKPVFDQCVDTIVRQVGDIRRMVDEFSKFARMPEPEKLTVDLVEILRESAALQSAAHPQVAYPVSARPDKIPVSADRGMLGQVCTNLMKNAAEAVEARMEACPGGPPGEIRTKAFLENDHVVIEISDNGVGLPKQDRRRLTEPYVTTRAKGTGLGLAIVKRIVEQHGGVLALTDAPPFAPEAHCGALARVLLPLAKAVPAAPEAGSAPALAPVSVPPAA